MAEAEQVLMRLAQLYADPLMDGEALTTTLHAAVFGEALRSDRTPRKVLDALWHSAPDDATWNDGLRESLADAVAELE